MNSSPQKQSQHHSLLVLDHCDPQVSPEQLVQLNRLPPTLFGDGELNAGYQVVLTGYAGFIFKKEGTGNDFIPLQTLLNGLRATPRPHNAFAVKRSVDSYRVENDYFRVDYRVFSGQVQVYNIQPVDRLQKQRDRLEKAGTYKVRKNASGIWEIAGKADVVATPHGAVNGMLNNLNKATWLMGNT